MTNTKDLWLIVADSESARLLRGRAMQHDHLHLDEVSRLTTTFVGAEHHRPARLSQPGRSGSTPQDHASKVSHFAREVSSWVEKELTARSITRCALFAPSHLLGALRKEQVKGKAGLLTEHEGELAQMSLADLARHPRIVALQSS
jgi:protein required for attachment to host cells